MLDSISRDDRLRLLQFVCSFAWIDLEVAGDERQYVDRVMRVLEISEDEQREVRTWLDHPPSPDSVDPNQVPTEHRELFIKAVEGLVAADSRFSPEERDHLVVFKQLLRNSE